MQTSKLRRYLRTLRQRGGLIFFPVAFFGFVAPAQVNAEPVNLLVNGSFNSVDAGWDGATGGESCTNGAPSMAPWGQDGLVFSYNPGSVSQNVVIPVAGQVTLEFTGTLGQAGGYYEASLSDQNESVSTGQLINQTPESYFLTVTTESNDEVVTVTFSGVDQAWWADCYGPIITNAALYGEPAVEETTTTTEVPTPEGGLNVVGYQITNIPPTISDEAYQQCGTAWYPNILQTWDSPNLHVGTCGWDQFMMHYYGTIEIPEHTTIEFRIFSDDGSHVAIGNLDPFGLWTDKGCSPSDSGQIDIPAGTYSIDAWMYENGGGTCFEFYWNIDNSGWTVVPSSAFTGAEPSPPSTTTTTTTIPETTTTTTSVPETTTTSEVTTTTEQIPTTTDGSSNPNPEETSPPETQPEDTTPPEETTPPQETTPETPIEPEQPEPGTSMPTDEQPVPETAVPESTPDEEIEEPETTPPLEEPVLEEMTDEQLAEFIAEVDASELSIDQIAEIFSSETLSRLSDDEVSDLIDSIDPSSLTQEQSEAIAEALSDAPDDVKNEFETQINVFGGGFDNYVPLGSKISVAQRRAIIATTAVIFAMPAPAVVRSRGK